MATKIRLPEPDRDFEDKIRNYLNNLVRTLQYAFDQTPTLFPELGDAPSFYKNFGGHLVAVTSNEQGLEFIGQTSIQAFSVRGGVLCDVSGRVCNSFGVGVSAGRKGRGAYTFYNSPDFSSTSFVYPVARVIMTSLATGASYKRAEMVSVTTSTVDVFTMDATPSASDQNNQRVFVVWIGG